MKPKASFNSDFSLMDLNCCGFSPGNDAISSDSLVCYLPMPFKKGDILKRKSYSFAKISIIPDVPYSTPCVFCRGIPSDSGCKQLMDASDIIIYGWYVDRKTGKIKKDHFEHRYDFEYLSGELTSKEKVLYSVSAFLNEETNFNEEEAILTSLYHLTCDRIEEYRKTKDNPLLNYIFLKDNEKSSLRRQYTSVDKLIRSFDQADDSIRIWLDDIREAPEGYYHCHSVNEMINKIRLCEKSHVLIKELNLDHDLGNFTPDGGDAVKLLDWLDSRQTFYPVKIHTANPVGRRNMERIIEYHWPKSD